MKTKRYMTPLLVLMAWMLSAPALAATKVRGDVNDDTKLTISDVTALVTIIKGLDNDAPYKFDHAAADVNKDGSIDDKDVKALVQLILSPKTDVEGNFIVGDTDEEDVHDDEVDGGDAWVKRKTVNE